MKKKLAIVGLFIGCFGYLFPQVLEANSARELFFKFVFFLIIGFWIRNIWVRLFYLWAVFTTYWYMIVPIPHMIMKLMAFYNLAIAIGIYQLIITYIKKDEILRIINFICIITVLNVIMAYLQYFGVNWIYSPKLGSGATMTGTVIHGFMHNPNHFSALLGITVCLFFRKNWWMWIPMMILVLFLKNHTLSHTRAGIMLIAFTFLFFIYHYAVHYPTKLISILFFMILEGIAVYLLVTNSTGRIMFWDKTLEYINGMFWIKGYGLGTYSEVRPAGKAIAEAHNEYVQLIFEMGIIPMVFIIGYMIQKIIQFIKSKKDWQSISIFCGLCCLTINCITNFTMHITVLMLVGLSYMALWEILIKED